MAKKIPNCGTPECGCERPKTEQSTTGARYCLSWSDDSGDQHVYTGFEPTAWTIAKGLSKLGISFTIDTIITTSSLERRQWIEKKMGVRDGAEDQA